MSIGETSTSTLIPQITIDRDGLNPIEQDAEQDVKLMDDTLKTAWDVISNYDPKGESLSVAQGRYDDADLDSASSDDEFEKNPLKVTETVQHRSPSLTPNSPNFPLASIYHDHQLPREALDRLVEMHQLEGKTRLKIDQPHRAEQELIKAIEYAHKRKEWYGVSFPSTLMQEDLAEIYKQQHKYDEALDVWLDLLPRTQDAPGPLTVDNCRHYYLVADTYYEKWRANQVPSQQSDLNRALKFALTAFKGRYSMRERDEALIHESAGLLVLIYTALSDTTAAAVYRSFMPTPVIEEEPAAVDDDGSPVLSLSSQRRFSLAEPSFDPNKDANLQLRDAIKTRHVPTVLALLQRPEIDLERVFKHGRTPLMYAFQRSKSESLAATTSIVDALLAAGAKIYAEDEEGRTVLHQAAARADADMIRLAIRKDAGLEARDKHRHTPLLVAVSENHRNAKAAVQTLLEHNADKAARDDSDWTVVHHAAHKSAKAASQPAYNHAADVLRLLLDQGANVDALARNKATPLCLVANIGDAATAEVLLNANANVNHRSAAGRSPLYLAVNNHGLTPEYEAVVKTLLAHKAEVDERILPARWKDFQHLQRVANAASAASAANVTSGAETAVGGGAARERGASVSHGMRRVSTATTTTTDRRDSTTDSASLSQVDSSGAGGSTTGGSVSSLGSALGRGLMSPRNWAKRKKSETSAVMPF
jgi:ankyrin repeat protein